MKNSIYTTLFFNVFFFSISNAVHSQIGNVTINYPEVIEGKEISDSTLNILRTLDQVNDKQLNWYYERYTYLKRTAPSTDVEVILDYATLLREKNLLIKTE